ncbi:hypothetical protein AcV5_007599 [Taiwanofungus camphoratus]|nr:hypothetical protein AcW2_007258 [Antrodia cinnamomea]KAI0926933.1 hypothetical protein AcV5_007599 [Antrodia cinnamomea]
MVYRSHCSSTPSLDLLVARRKLVSSETTLQVHPCPISSMELLMRALDSHCIPEKELYKRSKVQIVGVSRDPVGKQKAFVEKEKLTYPVLSDVNGEARKAYHVGKGLMGLTDARVTFFIDSKGVVRDVVDTTVNYGAHAKFVTRWLEKIEAEGKQIAESQAPAPSAEPAAGGEPQEPTNQDAETNQA